MAEKEAMAKRLDRRVEKEMAAKVVAERRVAEAAEKANLAKRRQQEEAALKTKNEARRKASEVHRKKMAEERRARMTAVREKFRAIKKDLTAKVARKAELLIEEFYETARVVSYLFEMRWFYLIKEVQEDRMKILSDLERIICVA